MNKVNPDNYIVIQGWMLSDLNLKGTELIVYAIIYGFSQAEENCFSGSLGYLSEWTNTSKMTIMTALKGLQDKGLIDKYEDIRNGVKFCRYRANNLRGMQKTLPGIQNSLPGDIQKTLPPSKETLPNNIEDNKEPDNKRIRKGEEAPSCSQIVDLFNQICVSYPQVKVLSDARRKAINARLKRYTEDDLKTAFEKAEASSFLKGGNDRNWSANFDWVIKDTNLAKILDGNYDDREPKSKTSIYKNIINHTEDLYNQGLREWVAGE